MNERQAMLALIPKWYSTRKWAETLLCEQLKLTNPEDLLAPSLRGQKPIGNSGWFYRTHGIGVDIYQGSNQGGIDFDFSVKKVSSDKLREFMIKQMNAGNLSKKYYRALLQDTNSWDSTYESIKAEI